MKELTGEERLVWANQVYLKMLRSIITAVEERYGKEGRQAVTSALYDVGKGVAKELCELLGVRGKEPMDYAKLHCYQDTNLWAIKEEIIPGESGAAILRASYCPAQGIYSSGDCAKMVPYVQGLIDAVNPNLKWTATKVLTRGDDCCEFIISKE